MRRLNAQLSFKPAVKVGQDTNTAFFIIPHALTIFWISPTHN